MSALTHNRVDSPTFVKYGAPNRRSSVNEPLRLPPADGSTWTAIPSSHGAIRHKRGQDEGVATREVRLLGVQQVHPPAVTTHGRPTSRDPPRRRRGSEEGVNAGNDPAALAGASKSGPGQRRGTRRHREGGRTVRLVPEDGLRP